MKMITQYLIKYVNSLITAIRMILSAVSVDIASNNEIYPIVFLKI